MRNQPSLIQRLPEHPLRHWSCASAFCCDDEQTLFLRFAAASPSPAGGSQRRCVHAIASGPKTRNRRPERFVPNQTIFDRVAARPSGEHRLSSLRCVAQVFRPCHAPGNRSFSESLTAPGSSSKTEAYRQRPGRNASGCDCDAAWTLSLCRPVCQSQASMCAPDPQLQARLLPT